MKDNAFATFTPTPFSPPFPIAPLSFDVAYPDYAITSSLLIFRLPPELWPHVTRHLTRKDLSALALVGKDCRKLVALDQFRDVMADFSAHSWGLLESLARVGEDASRQCVRQMYVRPDNVAFGSTRRGSVPAKKYLHCLRALIERALPNLHILDWNIPGVLTQPILVAIASSPIKHLRLTNVSLAEDLPKLNQELALESLSIEGWSSVPCLPLLERLLRGAAPALRQLVWKGHLLGPDLPAALPPFPLLRTLVLDRAAPESTIALAHLLGERTRVSTLALDSATPSTRAFLRTRGYISSLKHFAWVNARSAALAEGFVLIFLASNPQLETLQTTSALDIPFISNTLLPLLHSFTSLTSLRLIFAADSIPSTSLSSFASLHALEHLWLSAGTQNGRTHTWLISHTDLLKGLAPLKWLRTLAFSRDTYAFSAHPLMQSRGDYYTTRALPEGVHVEAYLTPEELEVYMRSGPDAGCLDIGLDLGMSVMEMETDPSLTHIAWERWHREEMARVVQGYVGVFAGLTWCFVGQLAFCVGEVPRRVWVEEERREPCFTRLTRRMDVACWRPS